MHFYDELESKGRSSFVFKVPLLKVRNAGIEQTGEQARDNFKLAKVTSNHHATHTN